MDMRADWKSIHLVIHPEDQSEPLVTFLLLRCDFLFQHKFLLHWCFTAIHFLNKELRVTTGQKGNGIDFLQVQSADTCALGDKAFWPTDEMGTK